MTGNFAIAVHALVFLEHKGETLSSKELAENVCTNSAIIRKVMAKLHKSSFVETKEGKGGGYRLSKPASKITLKAICNALDEPMIKASWKSGNIDMDCIIASGMATVLDNMYDELDSLCMDFLDRTTIADIEKQLSKK